MAQTLQVVGALLTLAAFIAVQMGRMRTDGLGYLWLNLVGSLVLAALALAGSQWGFLLLEGVWACVSGRSLLVRPRSAP